MTVNSAIAFYGIKNVDAGAKGHAVAVHLALVVALAELAGLLDQLASPALVVLGRPREREDEVLVDLAEEQRLGKRGDALLRVGAARAGEGG